MALGPWGGAGGTSVVAVRSFNYPLMALAGFLLWTVSWRFGLVRSTAMRLLMLVVLHFGYGMSFCYRSCRPDMLGLVCLLLLSVSFMIPARRSREVCLVVLAGATGWIGLQVCLFAWLACLTAWPLIRPADRGDTVPPKLKTSRSTT